MVVSPVALLPTSSKKLRASREAVRDRVRSTLSLRMRFPADNSKAASGSDEESLGVAETCLRATWAPEFPKATVAEAALCEDASRGGPRYETAGTVGEVMICCAATACLMTGFTDVESTSCVSEGDIDKSEDLFVGEPVLEDIDADLCMIDDLRDPMSSTARTEALR